MEVHHHPPLSCDLSELHVSFVHCFSWSLVCKTCHFLEGKEVCHVLPFHTLCDNTVSRAACPCHRRKEQSCSSWLAQDLHAALKLHVDTTLTWPGLSAPSNATLKKQEQKLCKESTECLCLSALHLTNPRMYKFIAIHTYLYVCIYRHTHTQFKLH